MCPGPQLTRLCHLLGESLRSFPDLAPDSFTDENENGLLIALSEVFGLVKQWTDEYDSDEVLSESPDGGECSGGTASTMDNNHCLAKIIGDLMFLLSINNQYVRHLAGNTLAAISEFVLITGSGWDDFVHLLCICLKMAICNCLPSTSSPHPLETRCLDSNWSSLLKLKLKSADWFVAAAIFQVLRKLLKNLKQDFDEKIMKAYLDFVSSFMLNLPWDILTEIYVGHNMEAREGSMTVVSLQTEITQPRKITMFFGNFIQFLCSLVAQSSSAEDGVGFSPVICKIINLVPKLIAWSHAELQSPHPLRISHYFRHKVLTLMIKLSCRSHIEQATFMTWIHLLHEYFEDLLLQPISRNESDPDSSLEGSPFCTSVNDPGKQSMSSRHLQRRTVFLFLKCSLNLVRRKGSPGKQQFEHEDLNHHLTVDMNLNSEACSSSEGLTELHKWLQAHVPADMIVNKDLYFERCVRFSLSFLELFMHEDDILFDMLLQLLHLPFNLEHLVVKDETLTVVKTPMVYLASNLFNPVHLFHLFLAKIHFDHQVLLDYLISKDTGSSCAEYLLRSLRTISNSWSTFVEFPGPEESSDQSLLKGQNTIAECRDVDGVQCNEGQKNARKQPFLAARDCLLSLRTSIDSLNQKNLFPYNPQVLLRRLAIFQELCNKE